MDRNRFDNLTPDQQKAIKTAGGEWIAGKWGSAYRSYRGKPEKPWCLEGEDKRKFERAAEEMYEKWKSEHHEMAKVFEDAAKQLDAKEQLKRSEEGKSESSPCQ